MPEPGYYPDPNSPGQTRYWDGTQWSNSTQPSPSYPGAYQAPSAPGASYPTPPYPVAPQQQFPPDKPRRGGSRWIILVVAVVVVVGLAVGVPRLVQNLNFSSLGSGNSSSTSTAASTDEASCLKADLSTWKVDDSQAAQNGNYDYYGPLTNTCSFDIVNISLTGTAYDASNVQLDTCQINLNFLDANGSVTPDCMFTDVSGQIASVKFTKMEADKNFTNSCSAMMQIDLQTTGDWSLDTSQLSGSSPNGKVDYIGNVYNPCSFAMTGVTVVGVGYDSNHNQIAECSGNVDGSVQSKATAKATCEFSEIGDMNMSGTSVTWTFPTLSQIVSAKVAYVYGMKS